MAVVNRKARHEYEILETWEAGVVLDGWEVKSAKKDQVSLSGSRVTVRDGELYIIGMQINPYQKQVEEQKPDRARKLLLSRKEIDSIVGNLSRKGLTVVPLKCYNKGGLVKLEIGLVRRKKEWEKRRKIRKREAERKVKNLLKVHKNE